MEKSKIKKLGKNIFVRNLILAGCAVVIMVFVAHIFLSVITRHGQVREVPDFGNMTVSEATEAAHGPELSIEVNDSLYLPARTPGIILDQNPAPGAKVKSGRRIFVTVNAFSPRESTIPYVTGLSLRQAKTSLELAGFEINRLVYRNDIATNNILEERFESRVVTSGSKIDARVGSVVDLVVGVDSVARTAKVPKIVGFPLREAKGRLWETGFNVGRITMDEGISEININEARVYRQSPGAGGRLGLGADIALYVTLDESRIAEGSKEADRSILETAAAEAAAAAALEATVPTDEFVVPDVE